MKPSYKEMKDAGNVLRKAKTKADMASTLLKNMIQKLEFLNEEQIAYLVRSKEWKGWVEQNVHSVESTKNLKDWIDRSFFGEDAYADWK